MLKPVDPQELSGLLNRLSMEIVEERSRGQAATDAEEPPEDQDSNHNIRRFKDFIHGNYMRDISLEDVADYLNLHPSYVCSLLKRETHQTFVQYLRGFRINKGKKLLRELAESSAGTGREGDRL